MDEAYRIYYLFDDAASNTPVLSSISSLGGAASYTELALAF